MVLLAKCFPLVWKSTLCANSVSTSSISNYSFVKFLNLAGDENRKKLKTNKKQKLLWLLFRFLCHSKIVLRSRSHKICALSLARTQSVTLQTSKKTAFFKCLFFFYENVFHEGILLQFYLIHLFLFVSLHASPLSFSRSLVRFFVFARVFTKIHTKNYCSTVCVCLCYCFKSACCLVLFWV